MSDRDHEKENLFNEAIEKFGSQLLNEGDSHHAQALEDHLIMQNYIKPKSINALPREDGL